ncbi:hypothetical protein FACS1894184_10040 [Clostridia bacterium]|nr:hypothetical protein FACS1894184_10040 [Clostridia bacterium]
MSFGKMGSKIEICEQVIETDAEGFSQHQDTILANVRAYKEERNATEKWKNRAAFSEATCLFRFRFIPGLRLDSSHFIICNNVKYRIISAENVRERCQYWEVMADRIEATKR